MEEVVRWIGVQAEGWVIEREREVLPEVRGVVVSTVGGCGKGEWRRGLVIAVCGWRGLGALWGGYARS